MYPVAPIPAINLRKVMSTQLLDAEHRAVAIARIDREIMEDGLLPKRSATLPKRDAPTNIPIRKEFSRIPV